MKISGLKKPLDDIMDEMKKGLAGKSSSLKMDTDLPHRRRRRPYGEKDHGTGRGRHQSQGGHRFF